MALPGLRTPPSRWPAALDLHKNPIVSGLGEAVRKTDDRSGGSPVGRVRIGACQLQRRYGEGARRMDVGEHAAIKLEEKRAWPAIPM